jgi:hypothetical protein
VFVALSARRDPSLTGQKITRERLAQAVVERVSWGPSQREKKGDAAEGQASRGSGALPASVDVILELRRYDLERREDSRRVLTAYSRYDETPGELVIKYDPASGYEAVGTKADASSADRMVWEMTVLPAHPPGITPAEVRRSWPEDAEVPKPSERTLRRDLERAVDDGALKRSGDGEKGSPYRYIARRLPMAAAAIPFLDSSHPYPPERSGIWSRYNAGQGSGEPERAFNRPTQCDAREVR